MSLESVHAVTIGLAVAVVSLIGALGPAACGAPVSSEVAARLAGGWLRGGENRLGEALPARVRQIEACLDGAGTTLFYAAELEPSGFVILAGDDELEPVLAFASRGGLDPGWKSPLGQMLRRDVAGRLARVHTQRAKPAGSESLPMTIKWRRLQSIPLDGPTPSATLPGVSDLRVAPFVQSAWNQSTDANGAACFNYFTPPYAPGSPGNYVCGCVAVAMAQLMRYHQYPATAVGSLSFNVTVDGAATNLNLLGGDGAGGTYAWSEMPLNPTDPTLLQCEAIGALTHDCGVAIGMRYSGNASGAGYAVGGAFTNTFHYRHATDGVAPGGSGLSGANLLAMINPNLDARLPVLLGVEGVSGGHEAVCDGYGYCYGTIYHHLNMGWGGMDDVWYALPVIDAIANDQSFSVIEDCLYNVYPARAGEIISGRVVSTTGAPLAGVGVTGASDGGGVFSSVTDSNGVYALANVPPAARLMVSATLGSSTVTTRVATGSSVGMTTECGNVWGVDFQLAWTNGTSPSPAQFICVTNNGAITIAGVGPGMAGPSLTIPTSLNGLKVVGIGDSAFSGLEGLGSVTIPGTIPSIGDYAFARCYGLTNVTIGEGVVAIGAGAFAGCPLTGIALPDSVTTVGGGAFYFCTSLTRVVIGGGIASMGGGVFYGCNHLTSVLLSAGLAAIGDGWFDSCATLTNVAIASSVTSIGERAFFGCAGLAGLTLPNGLTNIGDAAFEGCAGLSSLIIPPGVRSIGIKALADCPLLTVVYFEGNAPVAGEGLFNADSEFVSVYFPSAGEGWGATYAGAPAASWTPGSLQVILTPPAAAGAGAGWQVDGGAWQTNAAVVDGLAPGTHAVSFHTPSGWTAPDSGTVVTGSNGSATLTGVYTPGLEFSTNQGGVTITGYLGGGGALEIPGRINGLPVTRIGDEAFQLCDQLTSVSIPSGVGAIGNSAFLYCLGLTNVTIPDSVTSVGASAFLYCVSLPGLTIPGRVASLGTETFFGCTNLASVYFQGDAPVAGADVFGGGAGAAAYYLPGTTGWGASFAGAPTAPWTLPFPVILEGSPAIGDSGKGFGFTISWATNLTVVVESCGSPAGSAWRPLRTNNLAGGVSYFSDLSWTNSLMRFYRVRGP